MSVERLDVSEFSEGPEITLGQTPTLLAIRKMGWWGSPKILLVTNAEDTRRLYALLAGNKRVGWACGYHWNVWFRYSDGSSESIDINRGCESFQRDSKEVVGELAKYFDQAQSAPTHFWLSVKHKPGVSHDEATAELRKYGEILDDRTSPFIIVASPTPYSGTDLKAIRGLPFVEIVIEPEEYDTGT